MMRRNIALKVFVLISACLSLIYIIVTLEEITGFEKSGMTSDLRIPQTLVKGLNNGTIYRRNKIESGRRLNVEIENSNTVRRNNYKQSDNVNSLNIERYNNKTRTFQSKKENDKRYGSIYRPLHFIPNITRGGTHIVPYLNDSITKRFLALPETNYTQTVAILTPIRNAERSLETFRAQLMNLSYPHRLLSVYFGESDSTDKTFKKALNISADLTRLYNFSDSRVINLKMKGGIHGKNDFRHKKEFQKYRRSFLAVARNRLVRYALQHGVFDHVLWIDSDIVEFPVDLVQQMLFASSDIVATSCLVKSDELKGIYDCNSWRETILSLKHQSLMPPDKLVLECYADTERIFLPYLKSEGRVVKLDGVGGCALMVKADCFRSGLLFPEVVYKRHIETEGLAKMALDMGYSVVGLPFVEVFHQKPS